jgi:hypothetical protein
VDQGPLHRGHRRGPLLARQLHRHRVHDDRYTYDDYRPAYRYGGEARHHYGVQDWDDEVERDLEQGWERVKGRSRMAWNDAKHATKDAWHRVERAIPGDFDGDGR